MERLEPKDRNGRTIQVGDRVRIVGIPDLTGMSEQGIAESRPVFEYLVGKYKKVVAFDDFGLAQFVFSVSSGPFMGYHAVTIEPFLLQLPQSKGLTTRSRPTPSARP